MCRILVVAVAALSSGCIETAPHPGPVGPDDGGEEPAALDADGDREAPDVYVFDDLLDASSADEARLHISGGTTWSGLTFDDVNEDGRDDLLGDNIFLSR